MQSSLAQDTSWAETHLGGGLGLRLGGIQRTGLESKILHSGVGLPTLSALNLFSSLDNELQIGLYHGILLLMDSKHRKLFVIKQLERCKFMPKCTKIRLAAGLS